MALEPKYIRIFNTVIDELNNTPAGRFATLAEEAEVSLSTLYKWCSNPPTSPQLRTLVSVAEALGYEIWLVKARTSRRAA